MAVTKIVIAGKNDIAVNVTSYLVERLEIRPAIICNKTETGADGFQHSLRLYGKRNNLVEYRLEDVYGIENLVFVSLEYDRLVSPDKFCNARLYNVHFSLLPAYKGVYTSVWPILNGEEYSGVTLHRIDKGIDTGDIIAQSRIAITEQMTSRDLYLEYNRVGTQLVIDNIRSVIEGTEKAVPQPTSGSSYYSKASIDFSQTELDCCEKAQQVSRRVRALCFPEYQYSQFNGQDIVACMITGNKSTHRPGTVIATDARMVEVSTEDYDVVLYKAESGKWSVKSGE